MSCCIRCVAMAMILAGALGPPAYATDASTTDAAGPQERVRLAEPPIPVQDFALLDQDGKPFKFSGLHGRTVLVFFGFTNCPNVCPPTLQQLRQIQRQLQQDAPLTTVFVSVDGERDTPAVMQKYLEPFMPGFVGLTGDPRAVRDIAAQFRAVFFKGMPTDSVGGYNVEHTSQVYLVDKAGRLRATFYNAPSDEIIATTRRVMQEAG